MSNFPYLSPFQTRSQRQRREENNPGQQAEEEEQEPNRREEEPDDDEAVVSDGDSGIPAPQRRLSQVDEDYEFVIEQEQEHVTARDSEGGPGSRPDNPITHTQTSSFKVVSPKPRSQNAFIRAGLRQSIGPSKPAASTYEDSADEKASEKEKKKKELRQAKGCPIIDGRSLTLRSAAKSIDAFVPARQWNKEERKNLEPDVRQIFTKVATGYVLGKSNKLNFPKVSASSEKQLATVQNLQTQLKQLKAHMSSCDIIDVMTIVVPVDVRKESTLECQGNHGH